ncbi:hypothetical protein DL546_002313 [Coniochaeta pulveracea]|nr:hypothetical protein DL546_002313 [Coniochaeta pulveracea]
MTVSNMQLVAKNPAADAFFNKTEELARQIHSNDFIKASLQAEEPAMYRATVAGAILATADETRQLTHEAIVNDLSETLHQDAITTEMQFRNMNTRVSALEKDNAELKAANAQLRAELDQLKAFVGLTTQQMVIR